MYKTAKEAIIDSINIHLQMNPELNKVEKSIELAEQVLKIFKIGEHLAKQPKGISVVDCQISYEFELRERA